MSEPSHHPRSAKRVPVEAFVKLRGGDHEFVFRTRDISVDGLFLYTKASHRYPIKSGDHLSIELYDYNQHILCHVEVVRVVAPSSTEADQYPCGFGVKITNISENSRSSLLGLIERVEKGEMPY